MRKLLIIAVLIFASATGLYSQRNEMNLELEYMLGIGFYDMEGLKYSTKTLHGTLPFDSKLIDNFPSYYSHSFALSLPIKERGLLGLVFAYSSTGALISSKDYSGEYRYTSIASSRLYGLRYGIRNEGTGRFSTLMYIDGGFLHSSYEMNDILKIDGTSKIESIEESGAGYYLSPGVKAIYKYNGFSANASIAYLLDFNSKVRTEWGGIRIYFGFSVFSKKIFELLN
jgi:hypothetical protein